MRNTRAVTSRRARPVLAERTYRTPNYQSTAWGRIIFAVFGLGIFCVVAVFGALFWSLHRPQGSSSALVPVAVRSGDTVESIAARLNKLGVVDNTLLFRLDARLHSLGGNLKAGDYALHRNMSIDQMVAALGAYHARTIAVTVPEGLRSEQIAAILQQHGIDSSSFLQEVRHPTVHLSILADKPAVAGLEGYLFPNTYFVAPHSTGRAFADLMVRTLQSKVGPSVLTQAHRNGMSVYQMLTLASIVEREARVPAERPVIASVYLNRLHIGMKLQADPTVQYVLGTPKDWWPLLTIADYQSPGIYNTYLHTGLPPGPIANPGLASIQAAANPATTKYLFFVASGHGHHVFAETYAQQLANEQKYQP